MERLEPDDYLRYLSSYCRAGLERFGDTWRYADLGTAVLAAALVLQPESYLEIGVRRGRSMAMVVSACPRCSIVGFDMWAADYAGMANQGPDFVRKEMVRLGHAGELELVSGNSHSQLPVFLGKNPGAFFDLITVDGDHSRRGAEQDLRDVLPRLKVGGVLVFDDICHPAHRYLADIWQRTIVSDQHFATWQYTELGYGVAFAVRRAG
ncbi:MAG TPA: class I SAM-dependent methyltransferase [Anaerolineae bacterium]|nr:class I SAM-dependent methyltransferase [Anaerolineae bacterium]